MEQSEVVDPAVELNRRAHAAGWPFHCDSELDFERHELNLLRDVWRELAVKKGIPSRADIDARTMKPFLRNIVILERVYTDAAKWRYRMRLAGSAITEIGGEVTGQFLDERIPQELLARWLGPCDAVLEFRVPFRLVSNFELPELALLNGESLVAPLADSHGEVNLILSCHYFKPKQSVV